MFKKFLCLVVILLTVVCVMAACDNPSGETVTTVPTADEETTDQAEETEAIIQGSDGLQYDLDDSGEGYSVSIGSCTDTEIVIANYYNGKPVISIAAKGFQGCTFITNVKIPHTVTVINTRAFLDCPGLTSIVIPDSVTSIGNSAFFNCTGLTSITIPDSVTSIEMSAFRGCTGLTSITIPDSVTSMSVSVFTHCDNLVSITVAEGNPVYHSEGNCVIETASNILLAGCGSSIIPDYVTSIDGFAFLECSSLTSIVIPDSVTVICGAAFAECTNLTSITIPNSVTSIENQVFECTGLTSITYEGTVAQWNAITKGNRWNYEVPATEVICSDGTVSLK